MSKFLLSLTMFLLFAVYGFSSSTHTSQKKSHTLQKPVLPYKVEEVNFENPEAGVSLSGTLTIPPFNRDAACSRPFTWIRSLGSRCLYFWPQIVSCVGRSTHQARNCSFAL